MTVVTNDSVVDEGSHINFGSMTMVPGEAFLLTASNASVSAGYVLQKQWIVVSNRTFLIVHPYSSTTNQLLHSSNFKPDRASIRHLAFLTYPPRPANPLGKGPHAAGEGGHGQTAHQH